MNNTILPYGLFLFIALFIYYGAYAIPYEKKHKPPEETSRWIFWVDVVLVKGILAILIIAFPVFTTWMWEPDIIQKWEDFVIPRLTTGLTVCFWGRIIIYYYYKFYRNFKK